MLKSKPLFLVLLYLCAAGSVSRYTEPLTLNALPPDVPDAAPAGTSAPVQTEEIPSFTDPLTGLPTEKPVVNCRPVAVVINNHHKALPQSGIGQAAICYEVLAEGNITRIVAVFHDFDAQKIGPVRSARPYLLEFAADYDAIFVHHGGSPRGYDLIEESGIADLDAMRLSEPFWRDPERVIYRACSCIAPIQARR